MSWPTERHRFMLDVLLIPYENVVQVEESYMTVAPCRMIRFSYEEMGRTRTTEWMELGPLEEAADAERRRTTSMAFAEPVPLESEIVVRCAEDGCPGTLEFDDSDEAPQCGTCHKIHDIERLKHWSRWWAYPCSHAVVKDGECQNTGCAKLVGP